MINTGTEADMSFEAVTKNVSEKELLLFYFGIATVPCKIHSLLRKDENPSFSINEGDRQSIVWYDFGLGKGGNIYTLLMEYFGLTYKEVISKIYREMIQGGFVTTNKPTIKQITNSVSRQKATIECEIRDWNDDDIEYWNKFGIPLNVLQWADIYPIRHIVVSNGVSIRNIKADSLAYVYVERKEGVITYKVYQPYNKSGLKWLSTHDKTVLGLWRQMPKYGEEIFICSSIKDALCLMCAIRKPCISLQGEAFPISDTARGELIKRFKKQYIILDNDEAGIADAKRLSERTGFTNIELPYFDGGKDLSDFYKLYGKEEFVKLINSLI